MRKYDVVALYRNKKSGVYIVQPMTRHTIGADTEFGEAIFIQPRDFDREIVSITMATLPIYHQQVYRQDLARRFSDKEYNKFEREHEHVRVELYEDGVLEVIAMTGSAGLEGRLCLKKEEVGEKLLSALQEAFRRAGDEID